VVNHPKAVYLQLERDRLQHRREEKQADGAEFALARLEQKRQRLFAGQLEALVMVKEKEEEMAAAKASLALSSSSSSSSSSAASTSSALALCAPVTGINSSSSDAVGDGNGLLASSFSSSSSSAKAVAAAKKLPQEEVSEYQLASLIASKDIDRFIGASGKLSILDRLLMRCKVSDDDDDDNDDENCVRDESVKQTRIICSAWCEDGASRRS
jgi:hypothetical protein